MEFKKLLEACKAQGIEDVEIYTVKCKETSISTFNQLVDKNEVSVINELCEISDVNFL